MKIGNTRVHCCLFNRECWTDYRHDYMPLRLHIGDRFWTLWGHRRFERWWNSLEPVKVVVPTGWRCEHVSITGPIIGKPTTTICSCDLRPIFPTENYAA